MGARDVRERAVNACAQVTVHDSPPVRRRLWRKVAPVCVRAHVVKPLPLRALATLFGYIEVLFGVLDFGIGVEGWGLGCMGWRMAAIS